MEGRWLVSTDRLRGHRLISCPIRADSRSCFTSIPSFVSMLRSIILFFFHRFHDLCTYARVVSIRVNLAPLNSDRWRFSSPVRRVIWKRFVKIQFPRVLRNHRRLANFWWLWSCRVLQIPCSGRELRSKHEAFVSVQLVSSTSITRAYIERGGRHWIVVREFSLAWLVSPRKKVHLPCKWNSLARGKIKDPGR